MGSLTILRAGPLSSVQDLGRAGQRALGVSPGGALDPFAAQVANLLVGNPAESALLELSLGGVRLRCGDLRHLAWCGGDFAVQIEGSHFPPGRRAIVRPGEEVSFAPSRRGPRAWLAISGGIDVPLVLASRSTDLRAGFGGFEGRALRDGDLLSLGENTFSAAEDERIASWSAPSEWASTARSRTILRTVRGADWDLFRARDQTAFFQGPYEVGGQADRMGVRLQGAELRRKTKSELLSEPVAPGTIQVTNDGQPILLLRDCQTIGGYPKIAHVITVDLGRAAQLQPHDRVHFQSVTPTEALSLYQQRARDLELFRVGLSFRKA